MRDQNVLILGAGVAGITVALELADRGIPSTVVEKKGRMGGNASKFACKASEKCNKCFACVADNQFWEVMRKPEIEVLLGSMLESVSREAGRFKVVVRSNGQEKAFHSRAIILATGVRSFDAKQKPEYGYGIFENVVTAADLNEILRTKGEILRPSDGQIPSRIAFFQCVGSRDETIGHLWCSKVCCGYALRFMKMIRHGNPKIQTTLFYIDIQPLGRSFGDLLQSCRQDSGVRLIRSLPSKLYGHKSSTDLRLRFIDPVSGDIVEEGFDLVVLSIGMTPREDAEKWANTLKIPRNTEGFYQSPEEDSGLFVSGACKGPQDIGSSMIDAKLTAQRIAHYLGSTSQE